MVERNGRAAEKWPLDSPRWSLILVLLSILGIVWFGMLGARSLVPTDEGRYAEMAREMLATGDWVTTRLNGIKYFEKPPLQIWMTALAFKFFGLGEWQARLWTGLSGFAGIILTGVAASRVFGREVGLMAAAVLASCAFWGIGGHINSLDMSLAGAMTLTLCSLLIAQTALTIVSQRRWMLACWAGLGLAVMSKGLIGLVLPGMVLLVYCAVARDWAIWKRLHIVSGLITFLVITAPWFILVSIRNPEFAHFFFIHEHFQRFTSNIHHREGPWYYFIPLLVLGLLPWVGVVGQATWAAARRPEEALTVPENASAGSAPLPPPMLPLQTFQPQKLLLVWSVAIFVFFSISSSKLPAYILPIFPAIAITIAAYLHHASRRAWWLIAGSVALLGIAMLALVPQFTRFAADVTQLASFQASKPWLALAGLIALGGATPVLWWCYKRRHDFSLKATLILACASFLAVQVLMLASEPHGRARSGLPLVPAIAAELTPQTPLYAVGLYDQTLPFYLRRTMILVQHADELEFGLQQEPWRWKPTLREFLVPWQSEPKAVAVMRSDIFEELRSQGVPMREIARKGRQVVVVNR